jgi:hypothetical protein
MPYGPIGCRGVHAWLTIPDNGLASIELLAPEKPTGFERAIAWNLTSH